MSLFNFIHKANYDIGDTFRPKDGHETIRNRKSIRATIA